MVGLDSFRFWAIYYLRVGFVSSFSIFFPLMYASIFFSCLISLARTSRTMLRVVRTDIFALFPFLGDNIQISLSLFGLMLVVGILQMLFIEMRIFILFFILIFWEFYHEWYYQFFFFFCIDWYKISIWWITLIEFQIWNQSPISVINPLR